MTNQEVMIRVNAIKAMLENGNSVYIEPTDVNKELFTEVIEAVSEVEKSKVSRGGFYVPLDEVQAVLMNIQRQMG